MGRIRYSLQESKIARVIYQLFEMHYKVAINPGDEERFFLIGCHLCGSPAVTGYSAEDPSKLLCGPVCNKK